MATDERQPVRRTDDGAATVDLASTPAAPLTNGRHGDSQPDATDRKMPSSAFGAHSDIAVTSTAVRPDDDGAEALTGDAAAAAALQPDDLPAAVHQLTEISLSQDLDSGSGGPGAVDLPTSSTNGSGTAAALGMSASLGEPLPASTARINSDAFFQDEEDANFTLDDGQAVAPPSAPTSAPAAGQLEAERAAQDREDEEIQQRLQQQREAAKADAAARSVSPPVYNRPMSPPPGSAPRTPLPPPGVEPPEFRGLLYYDGIDSVGRPVVVVNARADAMLQPKLRNRAMEYMKRRLEPIVYQGPYVLCMVASGHQGDTSSKLPAMWLIRAYRSLSRPYKKNVKYIVLVRPSAMLSTMMVVLRPFLSAKAARKLHKVDSLLDIDAVTGGDVKAEQLGARFLREELGVEPGASLTPTAVPPAPSPQRAASLDEEVQLGSY